MGSEAFSLNAADVISVAKGAALAALGAIGAYLATAGATFDQSTAGGLVLAAALSTAANLIRKYLTNTK